MMFCKTSFGLCGLGVGGLGGLPTPRAVVGREAAQITLGGSGSGASKN